MVPTWAKLEAVVRAESVVRVALLVAVMLTAVPVVFWFRVGMSVDMMALKAVPPAPSEKSADVAAAAPDPIFPWAADEPEVTAKSEIHFVVICDIFIFPY
jgi:hypothetical protein